MTLQELNEHLDLREKLAKAQELLNALWDKAHPGAQALTGMPHTTGVLDRVGELAEEIADLEDRVASLQEQISKEERSVLEFIATIDDDQTRTAIRLRFVRGLSWKEVAAVIGRWATEASIRQRCYNYLSASK